MSKINTGPRSGLSRFYRAVLFFLLLPSVFGIAICQIPAGHGQTESHIHLALSSPEHAVCDMKNMSPGPAGTGEALITAFEGKDGGAKVCVIAQEPAGEKHNPDLVSMTAHLPFLTAGAAPPIYRESILPKTVFLPEAFIARPEIPPRAS